MESYLFVFGRTPALSALELASCTGAFTLPIPSVAVIPKTSFPYTPREAMDKFGGIVKIAEVAATVTNPSAEVLVPFLASEGGKRIAFGISIYGADTSMRSALLRDMKARLGERGIASRFITGKNDVLSSA